MKDMTDLLEEKGVEAVRTSLRENLEEVRFESDIPTVQKPRVPVVNGARIPKASTQVCSELYLPDIINARALIDKNPPKPPQLIKGIMHQGSKMVLGGGSKSYKTWSLLDLGMSVSCGQPWWSFDTVQAKALYINLELPEWSFKERIDEITTARPALMKLTNFDVWNLRGYSVSFEKMRPAIVERIAQGYGLIIIDPIYKVYGDKDENSAGEMGTLLNEIERLAVESGAAVVFGAHFSKGNQAGKESIDRISGSGVFARDPDTILVMTKHELEDTYTVEATLRNLKPMDPFCVQRVHPLMERNDGIDPKKLKKANAKTEVYPVAMLLQALAVDELTTTEWEKKTCLATGMSARTFQGKLATIKDDPNYITKTAVGKWKATSPLFPPGWNSKRANEERTSTEVQQCN